MTVKEKMHNGDLYNPGDVQVLEEQSACLKLLYDFNQTRPGELQRRGELLKRMFAEIGEDCYLEPISQAKGLSV